MKIDSFFIFQLRNHTARITGAIILSEIRPLKNVLLKLYFNENFLTNKKRFYAEKINSKIKLLYVWYHSLSRVFFKAKITCSLIHNLFIINQISRTGSLKAVEKYRMPTVYIISQTQVEVLSQNGKLLNPEILYLTLWRTQTNL